VLSCLFWWSRTCCVTDYANKVIILLCINSEPFVCAFTSKLPTDLSGVALWPAIFLEIKGCMHTEVTCWYIASVISKLHVTENLFPAMWRKFLGCLQTPRDRTCCQVQTNFLLLWVSPKFPHSCINQSITFQTLW
jgi:hypothetical protein